VKNEMETQTKSEIKLPEPFEKYINSKLESGKKGRKHLVNQLNSIDKILELLTDVWLNGYDQKAIKRKYGIGYFQVYRFLKEIEAYKQQIISYLQYREEIMPKNFREIPIIKEWETKIRRSGHTSMLRFIPILENICNGEYVKSFKCHPNKLDLVKAQEYVDKYLSTYNVKKIPKHHRQALRHFLMVAKNINIPRGFGDAYGLSGAKENFGAYKFLRLNDLQIRKIREYLSDDLEALTFFDWSLESLGRMKAVALTKMNFVEEDGIVTTSLYETKTEKAFQKFLLLNIDHARQTWEEIKKLGENREYLFFDQKPNTYQLQVFLLRISKKLKEAYKYANVQDEYAYRKPFHFLRHSGAHLWLMRTQYDYGLVAELGWEDINTLRQVYGGLPREILVSKITALSQQKIFNGSDKIEN
jgi:hypothetical protein